MVKWLDHVGSITGANASCLKAWAHLGAYDACGGLLLICFGAFFGHLWPNMAYQLYDLCGSRYVSGSALFSEPPPAILCCLCLANPAASCPSAQLTLFYSWPLSSPADSDLTCLTPYSNCSVRHSNFNRI